MKNVIIMMWLIFAAFVIFPIAADYISGDSESEVVSIIEKESEADDITITAAIEHGNKAMYVFKVGESEFGVAIFSHFADNYGYEEGIMSNGDDHIDVNLDTGWDIYKYRVTADEALETEYDRFGGVYRMYAMIAAILAIVSVAGGIYGIHAKKRYEEQRKKGLAA